MNVRRRSVIAGFATLATGVGATGCLGGDGGDGDSNGTSDDTNGGTDIPEPTEADYATWMFDPETAGREIETHTINYREPASVPTATRAGDDARFDSYDRYILVGGTQGASATDFASKESFEQMLGSLGVTDAETTEERGGYEVYDVGGGTFGVDPDEMVVIGSGHDGVVRAIVDTRAGDAEPYTETNEDMGLLLDTLGGGHVVEAGDAGFSEGGIAAGSMRNGNEDGTVKIRAAEVYPDEETVDTEAFEEALLSAFEQGRLSDDTLEVDAVQQEGRVAVAVGTSQKGIQPPARFSEQ